MRIEMIDANQSGLRLKQHGKALMMMRDPLSWPVWNGISSKRVRWDETLTFTHTVNLSLQSVLALNPFIILGGLVASDSHCHLESVAILGATERAPLFAQPGECSLSYRKEIANC
ncbi:hypothetical protein SUGI_0907390 [Cryptomeria japonica]|nr:hypothetical protein SUGI_0907390 [Cryptomeria japonica]